MLVLGVESSAKVASCAVCEIDNTGSINSDYQNIKVISNFTANTGHTHSQTLLPILEQALNICGKKFLDMDLISVSSGPGSFTGVRIGVSTVKGIAYALKKPCCGVSSLKALGLNMLGNTGVVCAVMDARRNQVYNALFRVNGFDFERLCEDRAISIEDLETELSGFDEKVYLVGDGADLVKKSISCKNVISANSFQKLQNGVSVCAAAIGEKTVSSDMLMPSYLRLSQAERERINKEKENLNG